MITRAMALGALVLMGLSLGLGCSTEFIDPMERQKKYLPYEANALFPDGRAMRPLIEGTVPRERLLGDTAVREGMTNGQYVTRIPVAIDRTLLDLGRERFDITCAACHGILGDGQSVVAHKMSLRPPPAISSGPYAALPPGQVFQIITQGFGMMASHAAEIPIAERWAIIAYLEALKLSQASPEDAAPPDVRARLMKASLEHRRSGETRE